MLNQFKENDFEELLFSFKMNIATLDDYKIFLSFKEPYDSNDSKGPK